MIANYIKHVKKILFQKKKKQISEISMVLAYLPIIGLPIVGWMLPLYLLQNNSKAQFHAKQSLLIHCPVLCICFILWGINTFLIPKTLYWINVFGFAIITLIYLFLLLFGIMNIFSNRFPLLFLRKYVLKLKI